MATVSIKITPADHGRRMSLADFEHAEVQEGKLYELGRGVIVVSDIPNPPHLNQVLAVRRQLTIYEANNPGFLYGILTGSECKILLSRFESERHPDLAIYKTPPPSFGSDVWWTWIPENVIEVVSEGSVTRDYKEKSEEYFAFGVQEYWIVDDRKQEVHILKRRGGKWQKKIVSPPEIYRTKLLPGFELAIAPLFQMPKSQED